MRKLWLAVTALALSATAVQAQTYKVLYNFGSHQGDPYDSYLGIITQGRDGSLYFTAPTTTLPSPRDVFKITPSGILTAVNHFSGSQAGAFGGVSLGTDGKLYGSIENGGLSDLWGNVFTLTADGNLTTLYTFTGGADGGGPFAPPIQGIDGNFYGTTTSGGSFSTCFGSGCGTAYKITPSGAFTVLHDFADTDGSIFYAPLMQATNGDFYGTAYEGGGTHLGTIFKFDSSGRFLIVHAFDGPDGYFPFGALIQGSDGRLYGTTEGNVFKLTGGALTVLHSFAYSGEADRSGLVEASDGNFYGTTVNSAACGTIFRVSSAGDFATLYTFPSDGSLGCQPFATLTQHTNGKIYGTTDTGGSFNQGVFFSLDIGAAPFVTFLPAARVHEY